MATQEAPRAPTDAKPNRKPAENELGVLFVHGIGEQREGDTLTAFGEPLIDWVRDWIIGHNRLGFREPMEDKFRAHLEKSGLKADGIEVTTAELFTSLRQKMDPPHSSVTVRFKDDATGGDQRTQHWLLAECWWGEQVQAPPVFSLLGWLFNRGPWIAIAHFAERAMTFTRDSRAITAARKSRAAKMLSPSNWRHAIWPVAIIQFLLVSTLLQLFLIVATLFALIPIPAVRRYVSIVLQRATSILGDSYGLVANDTQRGAILTRFQETIQWLYDRCGKVVIVAHSQGAAVVHEAMNDELIEPVDLLITFGAGLVKLGQLRQCETHRRGALLAAGWIVPSLLLAVLLNIWAWGTAEEIRFLVPTLCAIYLMTVICTVPALMAWHQTRVQTRNEKRIRSAPRRWIDLYATSDPVPQGSLSVHLPRYSIVSESIVNRRSVLSDHTSYWDNKPEFVSRVAAELDKEAQLLGVPDLTTDMNYQRAKRHHRDAVTVMSLGWWCFILSLLAWAVFRADPLTASGKQLLSALTGTPFEFVAKSIATPGAIIAWVMKQLTGSTSRALEDFGYASITLGGAMLAGYLWWKSIIVVFTKWNRASLSDFLKRQNYWGRYGTLLVWPFLDLLAFLPAATAFCFWVDTSIWKFVVTATTYAVVVIYSALMVYVAYEKIPKDLSALKKGWNTVLAILLDATRPGDDAPSNEKQTEHWSGFLSLSGTVLTVLVAGGALLDWLDISKHAFDYLFGIASAFVFVLLWMRLLRLIVQRGYSLWTSLVACALVWVPIAAYFARTRPADASTLAVFTAVAMILLSLSGIFYFIVDRWLPTRSATA